MQAQDLRVVQRDGDEQGQHELEEKHVTGLEPLAAPPPPHLRQVIHRAQDTKGDHHQQGQQDALADQGTALLKGKEGQDLFAQLKAAQKVGKVHDHRDQRHGHKDHEPTHGRRAQLGPVRRGQLDADLLADVPLAQQADQRRSPNHSDDKRHAAQSQGKGHRIGGHGEVSSCKAATISSIAMPRDPFTRIRSPGGPGWTS